MNNLDKPYFSVIIPCYNSRKTIEMVLDSIVDQNFSDMEVIIQDDFSTDNFMELVEPYKAKLNIKYFKNQSREIHCPGNTRQDGLDNATGEWVTFIDHDDIFERNVFIDIKRCIEFNKEKYVLVSEFREFDSETNEIIHEYDEKAAFWLHGKFYNRQFLLDYNIRFKENLGSHEDHYFNQLVFGHLAMIRIGYSILKQNTYRWYYYKDSTGKKMCEIDEDTGFCFIDKYYGDYISSVSEPLFSLYKLYPDRKDDIFNKMVLVLMYGYFYYQSLFYRLKMTDYKPNRDIFETYLNRVKNELNVTNDDIAFIAYADSDTYNNMRDTINSTCGDMIEDRSFYRFICDF